MNVHFIAIGGSAMHNLAIALKLNGYKVSGSDDEIFEPSRTRLRQHGLLPPLEGWYPDKITNELDAVILGMHAKPANPELIRAQELGLRIYSYPEFLFHHSEEKVRVVIGGSHGKTTITGMVMHVLKDLGHDFDYLVGSKLEDFDVMVRLSDSALLMVMEGDEYLSSPIDRRPKFHWYKPNIALLSGIAWDHINVFPTEQGYIEQFRKFIDLIQKGGTLVYYEEDPELTELVQNTDKDLYKKPYGVPEYDIKNGMTCVRFGEEWIQLQVFGKHNLANLEGARKVCNSLGISDFQFYQSIQKFKGAANRLQLIHQQNGSLFFKDFAHAPSKVTATIEAVRDQYPQHQLIACLELHTYSSLSLQYLDQYRDSLLFADHACVYYNPHALEMKRLPELDPESISKAFGNENLSIFADSNQMIGWLKQFKAPDRLYLMMSSGNFDGINFQELAAELL